MRFHHHLDSPPKIQISVVRGVDCVQVARIEIKMQWCNEDNFAPLLEASFSRLNEFGKVVDPMPQFKAIIPNGASSYADYWDDSGKCVAKSLTTTLLTRCSLYQPESKKEICSIRGCFLTRGRNIFNEQKECVCKIRRLPFWLKPTASWDSSRKLKGMRIYSCNSPGQVMPHINALHLLGWAISVSQINLVRNPRIQFVDSLLPGVVSRR